VLVPVSAYLPKTRFGKVGRDPLSLGVATVHSIDPDIVGASVVAIGSFNPAIFSPAWFSKQGLLANGEADDAEVEAILPQAAKFRLDWLEVAVLPNRLIMSTSQPQSVRVLRDLVTGTFQLLRHSPISAFGLNRDAHFKIDDADRLQQIGDALVSKQPFNDVRNDPRTLTVRLQGSRLDDHKGQYIVTIEPSGVVTPGIYVGTNEHFDLPDGEAVSGAEWMVRMIEEEWDNCLAHAEEVWRVVLSIR
jgi:hypothetical protein